MFFSEWYIGHFGEFPGNSVNFNITKH